jgi:hypothetical protein
MALLPCSACHGSLAVLLLFVSLAVNSWSSAGLCCLQLGHEPLGSCLSQPGITSVWFAGHVRASVTPASMQHVGRRWQLSSVGNATGVDCVVWACLALMFWLALSRGSSQCMTLCLPLTRQDSLTATVKRLTSAWPAGGHVQSLLCESARPITEALISHSHVRS